MNLTEGIFMNILIVGCGMVGAELATTLDTHGHDVSVVDVKENNFDKLPADFSGFTTPGVPIDSDVLKRAGIEACDMLCAVTDNDNMNIMVCEVATEIYGVGKAFARVRDISKAKICESMGIHIMCPTSLVVGAACALIEEDTQQTSALSFENHNVVFTSMDVPGEFIGITPREIEYEPDEVLFAVIRGSEMIMYNANQSIVFSADDKLIFAKKA